MRTAEEALSPEQQQANQWVEKANRFYAAEQYPKAIDAYREAIELYPPYRMYNFIVGELLMRARKYQAAAEAYRDVLDLTPDHEQAWSDLGQCLLVMDCTTEAVEAFDRAIDLAPEYVEPLYYGALARGRLGEHGVAERYLRRALMLKPEWASYAREDPVLRRYLDAA